MLRYGNGVCSRMTSRLSPVVEAVELGRLSHGQVGPVTWPMWLDVVMRVLPRAVIRAELRRSRAA